MARRRKKPDYFEIKTIVDKELLSKAASVFKEVYEKNENILSPLNSDSYKLIELAAERFHFTPMKMRKLLITAGAYENEKSRLVLNLYNQGKSVEEIQEITGLKRSSVNGYLPYSKVIYKNVETSVGADRISLLRRRKKICMQLAEKVESILAQLDCNEYNTCIEADETSILEDIRDDNLEKILWDALLLFENFLFTTTKGLKFKYLLKGGEMFITRKESIKILTKSSIIMAFYNGIIFQHREGCVKGPKELKAFGASYLYPVFIRFGIITSEKQC